MCPFRRIRSFDIGNCLRRATSTRLRLRDIPIKLRMAMPLLFTIIASGLRLRRQLFIPHNRAQK